MSARTRSRCSTCSLKQERIKGLSLLSFADNDNDNDNDDVFIRKAMPGNTEKRIYLISGVHFKQTTPSQ